MPCYASQGRVLRNPGPHQDATSTNHSEDVAAENSLTGVGFNSLPPEVRSMIYSWADDSRVLLFDRLKKIPRAYAMPTITQLTREARMRTSKGYCGVGKGSHINFDRDIIVCDYSIAELRPDPYLEELSSRIKRFVFYDCRPETKDDHSLTEEGEESDMEEHEQYYVARSSHPALKGVDFGQFWFPNAREVWIVKVGEYGTEITVDFDQTSPWETRLQQHAKQFRYFPEEDIIEIAPLDINEPETKKILREGKCDLANCHEVNHGRNHIISKVYIVHGGYEPAADDIQWVRVSPWRFKGKDSDAATAANRLRWVLVERALTFDLRWEAVDAADDCEDSGGDGGN